MSENVIEIRKCKERVIIVHHHHHSQKVHKKKSNHNQPCCLPCLCPLRRLAIWYVRAGRPVLAIRLTSWTISSLVISLLLAKILSAICITSRMIVSVSGISLACSSSMICSTFTALGGDPSSGGRIRGWEALAYQAM